MSRGSPRNAFSLVELSIVLVILGLLTGGILAGQSLIRAAELRSVSTEFNRYYAAIQTFRDTYMAMPGDMRNATRFWGDQATGTGACPDAAIPDGSPGTCNGDGNGQISSTLSGAGESYRAWQHLALAGLIEGSYSGVGNATSPYQTVGVNVPASRVSRMGYTIYYGGAISNPNWFPMDYGTMMSFGAAGNQSHMVNSPLKGEEAWNIDTKIDDGKPGSGFIVTPNGNGLPLCVSGTDPATATYIFTSDSIGCIMVRRNM